MIFNLVNGSSKLLSRGRESAILSRIISAPAHHQFLRCSMSMGAIQWVFYLCCVIWDLATLLLSLFYLSQIQTTSPL